VNDLSSTLRASVALERHRGTASFGLIEVVANTIRDMLGDDFDTEAFLDTLDGECDAMDILGRLILSREDAKAHEAASKAVADDYAARTRRMADKQRAVAKAIGQLLDAIGERKIAHPLGTVSRKDGTIGVEITDEDSVPTQLCKITRTPDKAAIRAAIEAGEDIPGAALRRGEPGIIVRVK
jgi:hypothetical protein